MHKSHSTSRNFRRVAGKAALVSMAVAASTAFTSSAAMAAVVCGPTSNISIPNTFNGVYINFVTGVTGTTTGAVPGWDFGPWGTTTLNFFWPSSPATSFGGVSTDGGTTYALLPSGSVISSASTYLLSAQAAATTGYQAGNTSNYLGFRFFNEATSAINYGWALIQSTATTGFPATIVQYCYQNDGTQITAGTTPVSLQNFSVD